MKRLLCLFILSILLLSGCSILRDFGKDYCKESKLNTEAIISTGHCVLDAWPSRKGLIEPWLPQMSQKTVDAIEELDKLAEVPSEERTDYQLGLAIMRCIEVKAEFTKMGLERYFPELLRYWP